MMLSAMRESRSVVRFAMSKINHKSPTAMSYSFTLGFAKTARILAGITNLVSSNNSCFRQRMMSTEMRITMWMKSANIVKCSRRSNVTNPKPKSLFDKVALLRFLRKWANWSGIVIIESRFNNTNKETIRIDERRNRRLKSRAVEIKYRRKYGLKREARKIVNAKDASRSWDCFLR